MMMWFVGNQNFGNTVEEFWTISIFFRSRISFLFCWCMFVVGYVIVDERVHTQSVCVVGWSVFEWWFPTCSILSA